MEKRRAERQRQETAVKLILGLALIAAAVGVFFLTDAGRSLVKTDATTALPSPTVLASPEGTQYPAQEAFFEAASQNGLTGSCELSSNDTRGASYALTSGEDKMQLSISLDAGRVTAFTLEAGFEAEAEGEGLSLVEGDMNTLVAEKNARVREWLKDSFVCLALALDSGNTASRSTVESLLPYIDGALDGDARKSAKAGAFTFTVYAQEDEGRCLVTVLFAGK